MAIDPYRTVAGLVLDAPARARVLEQFGIDYCCGGTSSLAHACAHAGYDLNVVVRLLEAVDANADAVEAVNWAAAPVADLCDHIVHVHRGRLRAELPRLSALLARVEAAHAAECPEVVPMRATFEALRLELEHHMCDEEETLFPACRAGKSLGATILRHLEDEHAEAGAALAELRELSHGYDLGRALCNTHRATLDGLRELELELHRHIHEENNILFPRVLAEAA